jgi:hypothetical protein
MMIATCNGVSAVSDPSAAGTATFDISEIPERPQRGSRGCRTASNQ